MPCFRNDVGETIDALRIGWRIVDETIFSAPYMVQALSQFRFYVTKEIVIAGSAHILAGQQCQKRGVVQGVVRKRALFAAGTVNGFSVGLDAIGNASVLALSIEDILDRRLQIRIVDEFACIFYEVVVVSGPQRLVVPNSVRCVKPNA